MNPAPRRIRWTELSAFLFLLGIASCAHVPPPTAEEHAHAEMKYPGITLDQLSVAKRLYFGKCGSCHILYKSASRTVQEWEQELGKMSRKVRLADGEMHMIKQYLFSGAREDGTVARGNKAE